MTTRFQISRCGRGALISEAARRCGLTHRAIRLYEQIGLISSERDDCGVRYFDGAALQRLRYIARARQAGLGLKDIAQLMEVEQLQGVAARDRLAMDLCGERLKALDAAKAGLTCMIETLRAAESCAA